jgi:hypothetical protein
LDIDSLHKQAGNSTFCSNGFCHAAFGLLVISEDPHMPMFSNKNSILHSYARIRELKGFQGLARRGEEQPEISRCADQNLPVGVAASGP